MESLPTTESEQDKEQNEEPPPKKIKTLFSFMPDTDSSGSHSQPQSMQSSTEVDAYLQAGSVSMTTTVLERK